MHLDTAGANTLGDEREVGVGGAGVVVRGHVAFVVVEIFVYI